MQGGEGPASKRQAPGYPTLPPSGERFQEQQRNKSGEETARDHSTGTFVKDFQICFKNRSDESFAQLGE